MRHVVTATDTTPVSAPLLHSVPRRPDPSGTAPLDILRRRRAVLALNMVTILALTAAMTVLLAYGGFKPVEWVMLLAYVITLPWLSIGFWNSVLGFALDWRLGSRAATLVTPALARSTGAEPITARVAIVMPLRNEDPAPSLQALRRLQGELDATLYGDKFDFHVLSDTNRADIAAREEALVAQWQAEMPGARVFYRRRTDNAGYKAGNIAEWLRRCGDQYPFFLAFDADSQMGASIVLRLVRVMEASPEIGLLQTLVTGLPSRTFFTRAFQFGMRHGMRSYTLGSAFWQADCGPNWGHNALIRTQPFRDHCMLPVLPGTGPLSGHILSHDQVEAVLMRRAGYEVRVLAEESDSHEENPPSLVDFVRRELRWCNGNLQYLRLLTMPGLLPVSRMQLFLAIQMYIAPPAWMLFIVLGAWQAADPAQYAGIPVWAGLTQFAVIMTMNLMPKVMGLAQVAVSHDRAARYGGRGRVIIGGLVEILFSMLTAPIVAFSLSRFVIGVLFGKRSGWDAQQRSRDRLEWSEAWHAFWPQTLFGLCLAAWLITFAPVTLYFAAPMLIAMVFAVPLTVVTTMPGLSQWSVRLGLFDIPEDRAALRSAPLPMMQADAA